MVLVDRPSMVLSVQPYTSLMGLMGIRKDMGWPGPGPESRSQLTIILLPLQNRALPPGDIFRTKYIFSVFASRRYSPSPRGGLATVVNRFSPVYGSLYARG